MKIELRDTDDKFVKFIDGDDKNLMELGFAEKTRLHITDSTVPDGCYDLTDENAVSYDISKEDYAKREDSVLAWKKRNKIGQFRPIDPEETKRFEEEKYQASLMEKNKIESLKVGSRCEVRMVSQSTKRGVIKFIGETKFKPGYWVGVKYDEPLGKNDGSVDGVTYFSCPPKYGGFVKPQFVECGDFPELGIDELDEI